MRYFLDTEFQEGFYKPLFGRRRHFIDLISIALVAEDGREYYAVSKEFNLKSVWKDEWLRENVLRALYEDLWLRTGIYCRTYHPDLIQPFTRQTLQNLIGWYGRTNQQIKNEIVQFVCPYVLASEYADMCSIDQGMEYYLKENPPEFWADYADYDWVLFCSLFGRMIDLPKGFPMYCRDLKQVADDIVKASWEKVKDSTWGHIGIDKVSKMPGYPQNPNQHHALWDARYDRDKYKFLHQL
jgi:hypothetical protein